MSCVRCLSTRFIHIHTKMHSILKAGLFIMDEPYSEFDTLNDWPKVKKIIEEQMPHWTPGQDGHKKHI